MINIDLSFKRLNEDAYGIEQVFQKAGYGWPGDWEGRALLAFNCLYEITGQEIPCMHQMVEKLKEKTDGRYYFGASYDNLTVDEQQISGHNWLLRGLIKYAENFDGFVAREAVKSVVESLYLPIAEKYESYPLNRNSKGGVSGEIVNIIDGWKISSDVGCAYICVDGLAHYYAFTKDERARVFLDNAISAFKKTDIVKYGFQTHATLSCLRGMLKYYLTTGKDEYLKTVRDEFGIYLRHGMTVNYENYNWFNKKDSWTEPCAVVDSFILATELYKITGESE
ncbi:MAG: hypothetical protein IJS67_03585, partial [Clostridia bacterium]|nr:hypothetical protein [Clostridia bacterium]